MGGARQIRSNSGGTARATQRAWGWVGLPGGDGSLTDRVRLRVVSRASEGGRGWQLGTLRQSTKDKDEGEQGRPATPHPHTGTPITKPLRGFHGRASTIIESQHVHTHTHYPLYHGARVGHRYRHRVTASEVDGICSLGLCLLGSTELPRTPPPPSHLDFGTCMTPLPQPSQLLLRMSLPGH